MKKIILCAIVLLNLVGCATVTPYEQGCRAGVTRWNENQIPNQKKVNEFCNDLDRLNKALEKAGRPIDGHGNLPK